MKLVINIVQAKVCLTRLFLVLNLLTGCYNQTTMVTRASTQYIQPPTTSFSRVATSLLTRPAQSSAQNGPGTSTEQTKFQSSETALQSPSASITRAPTSFLTRPRSPTSFLSRVSQTSEQTAEVEATTSFNGIATPSLTSTDSTSLSHVIFSTTAISSTIISTRVTSTTIMPLTTTSTTLGSTTGTSTTLKSITTTSIVSVSRTTSTTNVMIVPTTSHATSFSTKLVSLTSRLNVTPEQTSQSTSSEVLLNTTVAKVSRFTPTPLTSHTQPVKSPSASDVTMPSDSSAHVPSSVGQVGESSVTSTTTQPDLSALTHSSVGQADESSSVFSSSTGTTNSLSFPSAYSTLATNSFSLSQTPGVAKVILSTTVSVYDASETVEYTYMYVNDSYETGRDDDENSTTRLVASTRPPDNSWNVQLVFEILNHFLNDSSNSSSGLERSSDSDYKSIFASYLNVTEERMESFVLTTLPPDSEDGDFVIEFKMKPGENPTARDAASQIDNDAKSGQLYIEDANGVLSNATKSFIWTDDSLCPESRCENGGVCRHQVIGTFFCDCGHENILGNYCENVVGSVVNTGSSDNWKIPVIVVCVVVGAFSIIFLIGLIVYRTQRMKTPKKEKPLDKERLVNGNTATTSKGTMQADSIVFTVLEEGKEINTNPGFQGGSLPGSTIYPSVGKGKGTVYNERTFNEQQGVDRASSRLGHQY